MDTAFQSEEWQIGEWTVRPALKTLVRGGEERRLGHKVMATLLCLAEEPGRVVSKDDLVSRVWGDVHVTDESLTSVVYELRKALDDDARRPRYVATVRQGGYRLVAPVEGAAVAARRPARRRRWLVAAAAVVAAALSGVFLAPGKTDPEVDEAYQMGSYFLRQGTPGADAKARRYFALALERDPENAAAHVGLADSWIASADRLAAPDQAAAYQQAKEAVTTALEIEDDLPEAHLTLASISFQHEWDWRGAEGHFRLGFDPDVCSVEGGQRYAEYLSAMGRHDEAVHVMKVVLGRDPASRNGRLGLARVYYLARRYDEALIELDKAWELDPGHPRTERLARDVYLAMGRWEDALRAGQRTLELEGAPPEEVAELATAFTFGGPEGLLEALVRHVERRPAAALLDPVGLAGLEAWRGEREAALGWLERAYGERHDDLVWIKTDPAFDSLRGDARFTELLARLGLGS